MNRAYFLRTGLFGLVGMFRQPQADEEVIIYADRIEPRGDTLKIGTLPSGIPALHIDSKAKLTNELEEGTQFNQLKYSNDFS